MKRSIASSCAALIAFNALADGPVSGTDGGWNERRAAAEAPHLREGYVELAHLLYEREEWDGVVWLTGRALAIDHRPDTYISEASAWGSLPWDLRAMALYRTGRTEQALEAARQAARLQPDDARLTGNVRAIQDVLEIKKQEKGGKTP